MKELQVIYNQEVLGKDFHIYGTIEEPLFLAKDVAEWIDYQKISGKNVRNTSKMLKMVDEDEKVKAILGITNKDTQVRHGGFRENTEMWFLTENGLYEVLMQSRKPIAKQFKKKVKVILKEIRTNGGYINEGATPQQLEQLQQKIAKLLNYKIKGDTINDVCSATGLRRKDIKRYLFDNDWIVEYNGKITNYDCRYIFIERNKDVHFTTKGLDKILRDLQPLKPVRSLFNKDLYRK